MPEVAIVMGSDSDLPTMSQAQDVLEELGVSTFVSIVSAHRTPRRLFEFGEQAEARGFSVIIAGAGGAAHLPGMLASITPLPVIGVPVSATKLAGEDALLSIVQMPAGVPVATVAIDGAKNAGILAAQMIGIHNPQVRDRVRAYKESLEAQSLAKADRLENSS
ncbi:MAG: 5-(carboxyamino)imidazole ribonucleotide mutase [Pseudomonadota bacterium]